MRHGHRRALGVALVTLGSVASITACGLRSDDAPRPIAKDAIPSVLYQQNPASTTTIPNDSTTQLHALYIVRTQGTSESLVGQPVAIANPTNPRDLPRTILERLVSNPPVSADADLVSFIPPTVKVRSANQDRDRDVLDIDISNLNNIESTHLRFAVAQIVFTATELPEIRAVRFKVDGAPSAVPIGDGASSDVDAIITRFDFPTLRSSATIGSTTTTTPGGDTTVAPAATSTVPTLSSTGDTTSSTTPSSQAGAGDTPAAP